ncbi:MAG: hypothetical protein M3Q30_27435 [Actinomycetota bacterium]|nr:hypothetical protein [Actinomycetota bacterium]
MPTLQPPRLDADAGRLLDEVNVFLEALESGCARALLDGKADVLAGACESAVMLSARARRFVAFATHYDLESLAA